MTVEIRVPTLGESVSEATVGQWLKQPGDAVKADEVLVELETDKVSLEVPAPTDGVLQEIIAAEGETVGVDALLAHLAAGEGAAAISSTQATPAVASAPASASPSSSSSSSSPAPAPAAAKMMAENNLQTADIAGTGKRGQILKGDVINALENPAPAPAASNASNNSIAPHAGNETAMGQDDSMREERVRMTRLRQTIAKRLKDAQNTAAMLTTFNEVDMGPIMALRKEYKDLFEKKHGVKLGFMGFFAKAVCHALQEIPAVNAEIDGQDIIYKNYAHIGVAVGTDKGLVVPVVRDADQMSIAEIEKEIGNLGRKARDGKLDIKEMQGGTFTISNGGVYGSLMSTPILNAPQSGILGMHKIEERPVVRNGQITTAMMMYLALSYDHRVIDGKEAVTFLVRVKESLEDPQRLVLDL